MAVEKVADDLREVVYDGHDLWNDFVFSLSGPLGSVSFPYHALD